MIKRIVFQGDSITDAGRSRDHNNYMGSGYPTLVSAQLGMDYPGEYECLNRGVSGNRIVDLYARWRADCINLKPDIISILIGVNDVWHDLDGHLNGVEAQRFERVYDMLLDYTHEQLPDARMIILEPFFLLGTATEKNWEIFSREVPLRAAAARRVAVGHGMTFVPLQDDFTAACNLAPASYWLFDGVHPNAAGHELIARKLSTAICDNG